MAWRTDGSRCLTRPGHTIRKTLTKQGQKCTRILRGFCQLGWSKPGRIVPRPLVTFLCLEHTSCLRNAKNSRRSFQNTYGQSRSSLRAAWLKPLPYIGKCDPNNWPTILIGYQTTTKARRPLIGQKTWHTRWVSYQIGNIAGCACAGNAGNVSPPPPISKQTAG